MGTSNFSVSINASKYYNVLMGYEDDETGEYVHPEEHEIDMFIEAIHEEIKNLGGNSYRESDNNGNTSLGSISASKNYGGVDVEVELEITLEAGYYEGANLDFEVKVFNGYENTKVDIETTKIYRPFTIADALQYAFDDSDMNVGMQKIQLKNAEKWIKSQIVILSSQVETLFEKFAE